VKHLQKNGFATKVHMVDDTSAMRRALGIPAELGSCHTAKVEGYAIEGHVPGIGHQAPARAAAEARGLAAPGMRRDLPAWTCRARRRTRWCW
jgi:hypothetical protein